MKEILSRAAKSNTGPATNERLRMHTSSNRVAVDGACQSPSSRCPSRQHLGTTRRLLLCIKARPHAGEPYNSCFLGRHAPGSHVGALQNMAAYPTTPGWKTGCSHHPARSPTEVTNVSLPSVSLGQPAENRRVRLKTLGPSDVSHIPPSPLPPLPASFSRLLVE